jgi:hypothetical protein
VPRSLRGADPFRPAAGRVFEPGFDPGELARYRPGQRGRVIIRAFVQARLLGLKLLSLDACVVVGHEDSPATLAHDRVPTTGLDVNRNSPVSGPSYRRPGPATSLVYAMQLLEQGARTLEQSRQLRLTARYPDASAKPEACYKT